MYQADRSPSRPKTPSRWKPSSLIQRYAKQARLLNRHSNFFYPRPEPFWGGWADENGVDEQVQFNGNLDFIGGPGRNRTGIRGFAVFGTHLFIKGLKGKNRGREIARENHVVKWRLDR
jgi:hypothetical protein